jgi:hypothetical protein
MSVRRQFCIQARRRAFGDRSKRTNPEHAQSQGSDVKKPLPAPPFPITAPAGNPPVQTVVTALMERVRG